MLAPDENATTILDTVYAMAPLTRMCFHGVFNAVDYSQNFVRHPAVVVLRRISTVEFPQMKGPVPATKSHIPYFVARVPTLTSSIVKAHSVWRSLYPLIEGAPLELPCSPSL
eukprot:52050-Eustigmatos_ZCMA.PRE.1